MSFRDSKLTRILKGVLTGDSKTSVICNLNQDIESSHESLSTLRFGVQAGSVKLNIEKQETQVEEIEEKTPSTRKSQIRRDLHIKTELIQEMGIQTKKLSAEKLMFKNHAEDLKKQIKERDEVIQEFQHNHKLMAKTVSEFKGIIQEMKKKEESKKIKEDQEIKMDKQIKIMKIENQKLQKENNSNSNKKRNFYVSSSSIRKRNITKLGSEKYHKKRNQSKTSSRRISPRPDNSNRKYKILENYKEILSENKKLKNKLLIEGIKNSKEIKAYRNERNLKQNSSIKKQKIKKPIKKIQTSPSKRDLKRQNIRFKKKIKYLEKNENKSNLETEKMKKELKKIKKTLRQQKKELSQKTLELMKYKMRSPLKLQKGKRKRAELISDNESVEIEIIKKNDNSQNIKSDQSGKMQNKKINDELLEKPNSGLSLIHI